MCHPIAGNGGSFYTNLWWLLRDASWSLPVLRACASIELFIGLLAVGALGLSISYVSGTHGDLGRSTALGFTLVIALLLPYLVAYPTLQLLWVYGRQQKGSASS